MKRYTFKRHELVYEEIMLQANAPPEYADRQTLWNAVEVVKKAGMLSWQDGSEWQF